MSYSSAQIDMESPEILQKLADLNLSNEELARYRKKFDAIDLNKDGVITLRELYSISRAFGYRFTVEELTDIFGQRDLDQSGGITFDEFVRAMIARIEHNKRLAPIKQKFGMFDPQQTGYITTEGAYPLLNRWLGFDMNKTESLIDMYDKNKDYRLSMKEFIEFYKKIEELKAEVDSAFKNYDQNGNGFVEYEEAKSILIQRGYPEQQIQAYFASHDKNSDGKLDQAEFASFYDVPIFQR